MSQFVSTTIIELAIVVYIVVRQFQERPVTPISLLIVPLLIAIETFSSVQKELLQPPISATILIVLMALGLLAGGLLGIYRGKLATIRFNPTWKRLTVKASATNIILYLLVLVLRIAVEILLYLHVDTHSIALALSVSFLTTLFLTNIVVEKVVWYIRTQHYCTTHTKPLSI
jgi:heme/copper-type cytochrome/quinol oxidase subunit 4